MKSITTTNNNNNKNNKNNKNISIKDTRSNSNNNDNKIHKIISAAMQTNVFVMCKETPTTCEKYPCVFSILRT